MGWRADIAREDHEREAWRHHVAAQPSRRRAIIRARQLIVTAIVAAVLLSPIAGAALRMLDWRQGERRFVADEANANDLAFAARQRAEP